MGILVKAPGSCGELVQGTVQGMNFLVTCPVNLYSEVTVGAVSDRTIGSKTRLAMEKTKEYLGVSRDVPVGLELFSALPVGKGMASSSADISAACQATALYLGYVLTPDEIADIALSIEPTDGIFYPGIVMFDHVQGRIRRELGSPPAMKIAVFDAGGEVDTLFFNKRSDLANLNQAKEDQVLKALELVGRGVAEGDASCVGEGATISALANQNILYKPCLNTLIQIGAQFHAVGVNAAHSGTVLGILFAADRCGGLAECIKAVQDACPEVKYLQTVKLISGGLTWEGEMDAASGKAV